MASSSASSSAPAHDAPGVEAPPPAKRAKPNDDVVLSDVIHAFDTASWNGFGFQCSGVDPPGSLVIAFLHVDGQRFNCAEETKIWRTDLQTDKVTIDDWLCRTYIQIDWTLYDRIPEILNYALQKRKLGLHLHCALDVTYKPGETFDPLKVEERYIEMLETDVRGYGINGDWKLLLKLTKAKNKLFSVWNWQTAAGKQFCAKIRAMFPRSVENDQEDENGNFFSWMSWDKVARKHRLFQYSSVWWFGVLVNPELEEGAIEK